MKKTPGTFIGIASALITGLWTAPILMGNTAFAADDEAMSAQDEVELEFTDCGESIAVTGCSRSAVCVEIPADMNGKPVTDIDSNAFFGCTELKTVVIPDTVTTIGYNSFCECQELAEVIIPDSVKVIDAYAFYNCNNLTSVVIPEGVTEIEWSAFAQCSNLTDVTIPATIEKIGYNAFADTPWLKAMYKENPMLVINNTLFSAKETEWKPKVPDGVTKIADSAFEASEYLRKITLPDSLEEIGSFAFAECNYLSKIEIPNSVTHIGESAFTDCIDLETVKLPKSITSIEKDTFAYCSGLEYMHFSESVESIGECALASCKCLGSVTIENHDCQIFDSPQTIANYCDDENGYAFTGVLYGYPQSTAETYAEKYSIDFRIIGDVNYDGDFNVADLVSAEKYLLGGGEMNDWKAGDRDGSNDFDVYDLILMRQQLID
ncbi:MAG: leucine-rich repeat protein [Ruminococcus sp.]|nr:leucine-rich repeat protein [Ruminococcus sp.]